MKKKTNWVISIAILLTAVGFIINSQMTINELVFEYGKDYNKVRKRLNFPIIEDVWVIQESDSVYSQWGKKNRILDTNKPTHFFKTINLENGIISNEEDRYHFEFNDTIAYRLIVKSIYKDSSRSYRFIKYFKEKYPPTVSFDITKQQADSVLTEWRIEE